MKKTYLLRNALLADNSRKDILIRNSIFEQIAEPNSLSAECIDEIIDCSDFAVLPAFYNTHTHAAMTLMRGTGGDSMHLMDWLNNYIWPIEKKLTPELVYAGTRLAILEMFKSGCVAFNDMYFFQPAIIQACEDMKAKALVGLLCQENAPDRIQNKETIIAAENASDRIKLNTSIHATYTVSYEKLVKIAEEQKTAKRIINIHAHETQTEIQDSMKKYGKTPIRLLDELGLLTDTTILAHCCHLSDDDIQLLKKRNAVIAHCPQSNQKLASGSLPYSRLKAAGVRITIGTDGACSNNSLSMIAETKAAILSAKNEAKDSAAADVHELFDSATRIAANAMGFSNAGEIKEGFKADAVLVDLKTPQFATGSDIISNYIYAADSSVIHSVFCDGHRVISNHKHKDETEIINDIRKIKW